MDTKKCQKNAEKFYCKSCDFKCSKESNYNNHLLTLKHKRIQENTKKCQKMPQNENINENINENSKINICECGKTYKYWSGLWKHKKKCNDSKNSDNKNSDNKNIELSNIEEPHKDDIVIIKKENKELKELILEIMKQNGELLKKITETTPQNLTINSNNNCNNKTFNLQFFLNETCKNAMNLNQFVDNIDITMDDLKYTRINGLVEGISNIIIRGLNQLEIHERPIHCTDLKRDTLYIKDKEKWTKDENNEKFKETIEGIIEKEQYALNMWTDAHPDWDKVTHLQDEYVLMVNRLYQPVMEDEKKEKKIIHNISKEVYIQK